jgi:hypothetical protein
LPRSAKPRVDRVKGILWPVAVTFKAKRSLSKPTSVGSLATVSSVKARTPILTIVMKVVVVLALGAASVQASVIYSFLGTGTSGTSVTTGMSVTTDPEPVAFQLTTPSFLNPPGCSPLFCDPLSFSCDQLDSSTNCLVQGDSLSVGFFTRFDDVILFSASNDVQYGFSFPLGALGAPGVYSVDANAFNAGTLTVAVTAVPEPTAVLFVLGGICLVFVFSPFHRRYITSQLVWRRAPFPANSTVVPS